MITQNTRHHPLRHRAPRRRIKQHWPSCPSCGAVSDSAAAAAQLDDELETVWWSTTSDTSDTAARVTTTRHCHRCQPHTVHIVACIDCGDGPILNGQLAQTVLDTLAHTATDSDAETTADADQDQADDRLPQVVVDELTRTGWSRGRTTYRSRWLCAGHAISTPASRSEGDCVTGSAAQPATTRGARWSSNVPPPLREPSSLVGPGQPLRDVGNDVLILYSGRSAKNCATS